MRTRRAFGVAALLASVVAAGCAQDAGDEVTGGAESAEETDATEATAAERRAYVDAIVAAEADDDDLTPEQRTCVAESFVDGFGVDEIVAAGVTPEDIRSDEVDSLADIGLDFSGEQSASFYDRMTGCMDVKALLIDSIFGDDLPQEAADCLHENLSDDLVERVVTIGYTQGETGLDGEPGLAAEVEEAVAPCMALSGP